MEAEKSGLEHALNGVHRELAIQEDDNFAMLVENNALRGAVRTALEAAIWLARTLAGEGTIVDGTCIGCKEVAADVLATQVRFKSVLCPYKDELYKIRCLRTIVACETCVRAWKNADEVHNVKCEACGHAMFMAAMYDAFNMNP